MNSLRSLFPFLALLASVLIACRAQHADYAIAQRIALPGDGGWDYIVADAESGRLFVSHGTVLQVVDERTGLVLGTIPDCPGVHGIALANDLGKGFISCGRDSSVAVVDLKTLAVLQRVKVTGANPDAILYDAYSLHVFVFNAHSASATVMDARSNRVLATIPLDGSPEFAVSDEGGTVYVNIEDQGVICLINATTMKVEHNWSLAPGEEPSGLALDRLSHRLFSVCDNKLMVIMDAQSGKIITTLPIGERVDGVMFDATLKRAYSSNGDGTVTVVQEGPEDTFNVLETITTQPGARTCAVDQRSHHIFLPTAEYLPAPAATEADPHPRRKAKEGSFVVLDVMPLE
jgi:YVTN family beta-propeller protein